MAPEAWHSVLLYAQVLTDRVFPPEFIEHFSKLCEVCVRMGADLAEDGEIKLHLAQARRDRFSRLEIKVHDGRIAKIDRTTEWLPPKAVGGRNPA